MDLALKKASQAICLLATMVFLYSPRVQAAPLIIDDFAYPSTSSARANWTGSGGPGVTMSTGGNWGAELAMVLTCDFATRNSRCFWDRSVALNLTGYAEFELEVYAPNPGAISMFTLYFRSGSGWYGASVALSKTGWQTLRFGLADFTPEGTPSGWGQINGIRLSPWKATSEDTYLVLRQLRAVNPTVVLVRDTETTNPDVVNQTIDRHITWLGGYGLRCGTITRAGVEAGLLEGSRIAILPYNENVSEAEMVKYESYVASGGKLMVYYQLPSRLAQLLGVRVVSWTQGNFTAWLFSGSGITNLPPRVLQASWNITTVATNGTHHSRVIAHWENNLGQNTGRPAWVASDNGFFMSHVLLGDDADRKSYALLSLVGSILPDVWQTAASGAIDQIGVVGPYEIYTNAVAEIREKAASTLRVLMVEKELTKADSNRVAALAHFDAGRFSDAISSAHAARANLKQAYALGLKPVHPEFRAIWEHHATGPFPGNWAAAANALATNQFTAVFPNMLWGGLAHYNSAYLPHSAEYNQYGDQITACVNASHARGIEVHVWKVNWNLATAPQTFIDQMRAANRTQVTRDGQAVDWLCPSHPDNFVLETNSMMEVVRNYNVDGIHFDYIRYPDSSHCYCSGCGSRFQAQTGRTVTNWPADVLAAGSLRTAFLDWRRSQITKLVQAVYTHTKAIKPNVKVSAAVFPDAPSAYDEVGQDWRLWVTNGILDFVCPMDYTTGLHSFKSTISQQLKYVNGRMPMYPGIGAFILDNEGTLAQVEATRATNTHGFVIFELSPESAASLLPTMGRGITAPDEPDTDNDQVPDAWEQRWFGTLNDANANTDSDGDKVTDRAEYIAGTSPTNSAPAVVLEILAEAQQVRALFTSRAIEGAGYQNAARHYSLETSDSIVNPIWSTVAGYSDVAAGVTNATVSCALPASTNVARFYRLKTWLQQKP